MSRTQAAPPAGYGAPVGAPGYPPMGYPAAVGVPPHPGYLPQPMPYPNPPRLPLAMPMTPVGIEHAVCAWWDRFCFVRLEGRAFVFCMELLVEIIIVK